MRIFVEYTLKPMLTRFCYTAMLLIYVFLLCGCRKNNRVVTEEKEDIPINVFVDTHNEFNNGDMFGLFVVNEPQTLFTSGNRYDNEPLAFYNGKLDSSDLYYQDPKTKTDFYCYYPYVETITDIAALPFSVNADQSTSDGYNDSFFLWGKKTKFKPSKRRVYISMKHLTSSLSIELKPGEGCTDEEISLAQVSVCGLKTCGLADLRDGSVDAAGEISEIAAQKFSGGMFSAVVIPQSVNNIELIRVMIGTAEYTAVTSIELLSGQRHTCQMTISKTNGNFNATIGGWETDFNDYGGMVD